MTARSKLVAALGALACAGIVLSPAAVRADLLVSEYVEGSSNNKALELYNGSPVAVNLTADGYVVQMYFNGSTSPGTTIALTGTVAPGGVFVLAHASASAAILVVANQTSASTWFNGDDAIVLRKGGPAGPIVDSIGQVGLDPGTEWGSGFTSTADDTLRRKRTVIAGDTDPTNPFDPAREWDGFAQDTFDGLGGHGQPVLTCAAVTGVAGTTTSATVSAVADGTVVDIALAAVAPADPGTFSRTAFAPAPRAGGRATASFSASSATPAGSYALTLRATTDDAVPRIGTCTLTVNLGAVKHIGEVQGAVADDQDGSTHESPLVGQTVVVRGVVAQRTLGRTSAGEAQHGLFLQEAAASSDGDPRTSDGIFVFMGRFTSLVGGYVPAVGDEVVLSGRVTEYFNLTELTGATLVALVRSGVDLDAEVPTFDAAPPDDLAEAARYWERREGMRARVPAGSVVVDGRNVFPGTADAELWVVNGAHPVARRADPYARRVFRDAHPLDDVPEQLFDDGNGYRIVLGSLGVKAAAGDLGTLLVPARVFDTLANAPVGGVYFSFSRYQIEVGEQPVRVAGLDPYGSSPPAPADAARELTVASYNLGNLYDFRDDPFDGCDFAGDAGCPGVTPAFSYVPASEAAYRQRLAALAGHLVHELHAPDLVLVQEAEDQDLCAVASGALTCGSIDGADGRPDTLQELALAIAAAGGPVYDVASDRDGADARGIVSGFLFRTDRVELLPAAATDPVLGAAPLVSYRGTALAMNGDVQNPKALDAELPGDVDVSTGVDGTRVFTRAPQVGHFRVWRHGVGESLFVDLWALSNHFSSTPDARVGQRREQAAYAAAIVRAIEAAGGEPVIVGGDLNVFPRPDDPFAPGHPLFPSDQLAPLYDAGLTNLWEAAVADAPAAAYSYVFEGQAQTLDHLFVNPALIRQLVAARYAHVNADHPAGLPDADHGVSDHDPPVARFAAWPSLPQLATLVRHYATTGAVGLKGREKLLATLERAEGFLASGQTAAYAAQLQAFANEVRGRAPGQVTAAASDALVREALLLRELAP